MDEIFKTESTLQERELLEVLSRGVSDAFWLLWLHQRDYLYAQCLRWMSGNSADAEDALSRAMLRAWEKLPEHAEEIRNLKAWLTRLTYNVCMEVYRERQRDQRRTELIKAMLETHEKSLAGSEPSPDSAILTSELRMHLCRAIKTLPPKLRAPFILRFYHEKSYSEIAEMLDLSVENVRKRVQQAREIIQRRLSGYISIREDVFLLAGEESEESFSVESSLKQLPFSEQDVPVSTHCARERINYRITVTCLTALSHTWYQSFSPLGWN